jgi:hypothetical protein
MWFQVFLRAKPANATSAGSAGAPPVGALKHGAQQQRRARLGLRWKIR